jgi:hypothetical protein
MQVGVPVTVTKDAITMHNIQQGGAKFAQLSDTLDRIISGFKGDDQCRDFLMAGSRGGYLASPTLFNDMRNKIGVAQRFELDGNNVPGIGGMADVSPSRDIVINGEGVFYYGVTIPGTEIRSNSAQGQVLILLREIAHVLDAGMQHNDFDPAVNAKNNETILKQCAKAITGK